MGIMCNEMYLIFIVFHVISPKLSVTHLICSVMISADLISDHTYSIYCLMYHGCTSFVSNNAT
jgi:hypothetical protein